MDGSVPQAISAGIYNHLLFIDIDAFWEKTHVLRTYPSYAALRLPASFGHRSGSPCVWPTSMRVLVLCLMAHDTCTRNVACVGDGSPALRETGKCRGEARASQVTGPSSSCVPWSNTPPDTPSPRPLHAEGVIAFK